MRKLTVSGWQVDSLHAVVTLREHSLTRGVSQVANPALTIVQLPFSMTVISFSLLHALSVYNHALVLGATVVQWGLSHNSWLSWVQAIPEGTACLLLAEGAACV